MADSPSSRDFPSSYWAGRIPDRYRSTRPPNGPLKPDAKMAPISSSKFGLLGPVARGLWPSSLGSDPIKPGKKQSGRQFLPPLWLPECRGSLSDRCDWFISQESRPVPAGVVNLSCILRKNPDNALISHDIRAIVADARVALFTIFLYGSASNACDSCHIPL
jgi:hypothetical protein